MSSAPATPAQTVWRAVVHQEPGGGYWAEVPDLGGCYTQGDTLDEVYSNLREAILGGDPSRFGLASWKWQRENCHRCGILQGAAEEGLVAAPHSWQSRNGDAGRVRKRHRFGLDLAALDHNGDFLHTGRNVRSIHGAHVAKIVARLCLLRLPAAGAQEGSSHQTYN